MLRATKPISDLLPRALWRRRRLPRLSLEAKALFGLTAIVIIAHLIAATALSMAVDARIDSLLRSDAALSTRRIANALAGAAPNGELGAIQAELERSLGDRRVMYVMTTDGRGRMTGCAVRDERAWIVAGGGKAGARTPLMHGAPLYDGDTLVGVTNRAPIWAAKHPGGPAGYVTVCWFDPTLQDARQKAMSALLVAVLAAMVIAAPAVALWMRRITRPLRRIVRATEDLAAGRRPGMVETIGPPEITRLAASFNQMASRLSDAREAMIAANRGLEDAVQSRTGELRRANELLQLEISEKAEFVRLIGHDLLAPLRNIEGMVDSILRKSDGLSPDDLRDRLARVLANTELEQSMLTDVLELSRIGVAPEQPEVVDSLEVAHEVAGVFEHDLQRLRITLSIREPMPVLLIERARLRHVLQNLVDNAIKYMGESTERRIHISANAGPLGASFTVSDTGPGIPEDEHEKVFQLFRRASTAPEGVAGKGVGLASVKAMVERWNGSLTLISREGEGCRFVFTVPPERVASGDWAESAAHAA